MQSQLRFLLLLALAALSPVRAEDKPHRIRLEREEHPSQKTTVTASGSFSQSYRLAETRLPERKAAVKLSGKLVGVREVLELNTRKKAASFKFTVCRMTLQKDDGPETKPLPPGTEIIAQPGHDGTPPFLVDGKQPARDTVTLLHILFDSPGDKPPELTEDQGLGTDQPRQPGSEWAVDIAKFLKSTQQDPDFQVDQAASAGKAAFPQIETVKGVECCRVQADLSFKIAKMQGAEAHPDAKNASLAVSLHILVPEDPALPVFKRTLKSHLRFVGTRPGADGELALLNFDVATERTVESRPLK